MGVRLEGRGGGMGGGGGALDQVGIVNVEKCGVILSALDRLKGTKGILLQLL